ncbi:unnamed protein product [Cladocopium goreaui]|uniref:LINE-1 reverse transcriptase-like n=1 Tax=Cladocopium goreaui TaxID=2562237 RepID=A0A9P1DB25_9DINO|nr:unnamed protein product [Cladocopium goreaui]
MCSFCQNNVDPSAPPVLREWPDCRLECDSTPLGYEKTQNGWQCSPGYAGIPQASCRPSSRCGAELHLEGCNPIVPCLRPTFGDDVCRFVADCPDRLQPGGSCMVRCQLPYEGEATTAQCPHDNTRPTGEAIWARPNCSFHVCPDPAVFSVNYTKDAGSPVGWRCSDAMTGRAQKLGPSWDRIFCVWGGCSCCNPQKR